MYNYAVAAQFQCGENVLAHFGVHVSTYPAPPDVSSPSSARRTGNEKPRHRFSLRGANRCIGWLLSMSWRFVFTIARVAPSAISTGQLPCSTTPVPTAICPEDRTLLYGSRRVSPGMCHKTTASNNRNNIPRRRCTVLAVQCTLHMLQQVPEALVPNILQRKPAETSMAVCRPVKMLQRIPGA